jgi:hypothetical protein
MHRSNLFGARMCGHHTVRIHGFAKRIHMYTIPSYHSCNLNKYLAKAFSVELVGGSKVPRTEHYTKKSLSPSLLSLPLSSLSFSPLSHSLLSLPQSKRFFYFFVKLQFYILGISHFLMTKSYFILPTVCNDSGLDK